MMNWKNIKQLIAKNIFVFQFLSNKDLALFIYSMFIPFLAFLGVMILAWQITYSKTVSVYIGLLGMGLGCIISLIIDAYLIQKIHKERFVDRKFKKAMSGSHEKG